MTSPRGGSRTVGKRLIGDNAAHDHAAAGGRVARRGRALAGLRPRHRPSRRPSPGRHRHDGAAPGGGRHGPRLVPLSEQAFDLAGVDIVVNTHLHFDHCGGNHLFAGRPIHVQRQELEDARTEDNYTIREWVDAPGVSYEPVDGELELLPGLRLVPAPGHTHGLQVVVVETGGRPVVVGGDVAVRLGELDEPRTEGQLRVRALEPELVWLAHEHEPWRPRTI
jgi:N-acyl homoserine lactone hydrolase